jgi:hypothetical protein
MESAAISASGQYIVVVGDYYPLYYSTDYGNTFQTVTSQDSNNLTIAMSSSGQYITLGKIGVSTTFALWTCQNSISNGIVGVGKYSTSTIQSASGLAGSIYYDTSDNALKYSNGSSWVTTSSGTSTNAINVQISTTTTNAAFYPTFVSGTTGNLSQSVDSGLIYNPSTNSLSVTGTITQSGITRTPYSGNVTTGTARTYVLSNTITLSSGMWLFTGYQYSPANSSNTNNAVVISTSNSGIAGTSITLTTTRSITGVVWLATSIGTTTASTGSVIPISYVTTYLSTNTTYYIYIASGGTSVTTNITFQTTRLG